LGYEEENTFEEEYSEVSIYCRILPPYSPLSFSQQFGSLLLSRPHNDTESIQWSRNAGRTGLCTVITDPLNGCDEDSPPATSLTAFPPPVDVASSPILSSISPDALRHSPAATTFIPSTYSSLTGWAGEYDPTGPSSGPAVLGNWFNPTWQGSVRTPSPWGPESDIPDNSRSSSHSKIPYPVHHQPSLRLPLLTSPSTEKVHQLDGSNSPSSITPQS
jgi:hypothetical protein